MFSVSECGPWRDENPRPQQHPHQADLLDLGPRPREHPELVILVEVHDVSPPGLQELLLPVSPEN